MIFYNKNLKKLTPFGSGFTNYFATYEQLVLIYRTNYSLGCKKKKNYYFIEKICSLSSFTLPLISQTLTLSLPLFSSLLPRRVNLDWWWRWTKASLFYMILDLLARCLWVLCGFFFVVVVGCCYSGEVGCCHRSIGLVVGVFCGG